MDSISREIYNSFVKKKGRKAIGDARIAASALEMLSNHSDCPSDEAYRIVAEDFEVQLDVLECEYFAARGL